MQTGLGRRIGILFVCLLVVIGLVTVATTAYLNSNVRKQPIVYANNAMLNELWVANKANNIEASSGRTIDRQQGDITTSEGQSYTMLRAVWSDDKPTFDRSWQWTQDVLQRPDNLFSWKFGKLANGSYGILKDQGGANTASDGDTDIALSLLMAYERWGDQRYLTAANNIIKAIWEQEVVTVNGKPVLVANDLEKNKPTSVYVNPSYFAPYAYKTFAKVDKKHDWTGLSDNSYDLLQQLSKDNLDTQSSSGLVPNWVVLNRASGIASAPEAAGLDTNYGYDAMRTAWRMALDWAWFKDARDKEVLQNFSFLDTQWQQTGKLTAIYTHDGQAVTNYESSAAYGTAIGYFTVMDPANAQKLYNQKLVTLYDPDTQQWKTQQSYYDDNWAWFGMALQLNALPNITETNK